MLPPITIRFKTETLEIKSLAQTQPRTIHTRLHCILVGTGIIRQFPATFTLNTTDSRAGNTVHHTTAISTTLPATLLPILKLPRISELVVWITCVTPPSALYQNGGWNAPSRKMFHSVLFLNLQSKSGT